MQTRFACSTSESFNEFGHRVGLLITTTLSLGEAKLVFNRRRILRALGSRRATFRETPTVPD
jgi:hypothetical protein